VARGGRYTWPAGGSPRAAIYPDEVADALGARRAVGDQAAAPRARDALYEAALRLRNGHGPSLRALADLALGGAARKPQAGSTSPHGRSVERSRAARDLLEQVGDRYFELGDSTQDAERVRRGAEDLGTRRSRT